MFKKKTNKHLLRGPGDAAGIACSPALRTSSLGWSPRQRELGVARMPFSLTIHAQPSLITCGYGNGNRPSKPNFSPLISR